MALGISPYVKAFLFIITFSFLIAGFVSIFILETNPTSPVLTYQHSMLGNLTSSTTNMMNDMESLKNETSYKLQQAKASPVQYLFLIVEAAFEIPKLFLSPVTNGIQLLADIMFPSMGGLSLALSWALTMLIVGLVITLIFTIIKAIRTGESER